MKKTILIVSIIIVCGLAIFGIVKLTSKSDNSLASNNTAATITTENPSATNSTDNTAASTTDTKDASTSSIEATEKSTSEEPVKGDTVISIGSASASAEETVIIPVNIDTVPKDGIGSCNFNVKYDTNVLEVVEVLPGDITENIGSSLEYSVIETTGMVSYLFTSSSNGKDAIAKPGVITNIKFKVKKDAQKGATTITNGTAGAFGDNSLKKVTATFNSGEINVK
jgi:hypothetical protein